MLLLPDLKKVGTMEDKSRIVNVSSILHRVRSSTSQSSEA